MRAPPDLTTSGLFAGRYALERLLGEGATATVHLARDTERGAAVAVKILRLELIDSGATARFLKEIRRTSRLQHPHILPVLDSGEHEGQPYFVLPYMEGGTLRMRLKREQQLELTEALAIARTVGEALDYAHARGLVHCDVKPENILFTNGQAVLADFGIARALEMVSGEPATSSSGVIRGTPAYMSPEQAAGSKDCDGRSDIYSLGCVVYEMITGMPAFIGPTPQSVIAQRFAYPPREVRVYRATAPAAVDMVLAKAFAVAPVDRYRTAGEMVEGLEAAVTAPAPIVANETTPDVPWSISRRRRLVAVSVLGAAVATVTLALTLPQVRETASGLTQQGAPEVASPDTARFAVLPAESDPSVTVLGDVAELLREALRRWRGIIVVDAFQTRDAFARHESDLSGEREATEAATMLGAGRYVRLQTSRLGDSLWVRAVLFDTRTSVPLTEKGVRLATNLARADVVMAMLADSLLFRAGTPRILVEPGVGTRSLTARQSYLRGHVALTEWDLSLADSAFHAASEQDAQYTHAYLWLAQVRSWRREPPTRWRFAAEQAAAARHHLSPRDSLLSVALLSLASGRRQEACRDWKKLTTLDFYDFAAWYGLGNCLAFDSAVVRDAGSPSGWRFRTSYRRALDAYERAFRLLPSIHRSFRGGSFEDLQRLLKTSTNSLRTGVALPPDTTRFVAYPAWQGDSLAFVPIPLERVRAAEVSTTRPSSVNEAILHQRKRFYDIATMWRAAFPQSADALHAVAASLDLLGDGSAFDSLRLARQLATDPDDQLRIGVLEVWLRTKIALPSDVRLLRTARALADSLLEAHRPSDPREAQLLGSLAALLGRAGLAAVYARAAETPTLPPAVAATAPALLAFAAMGGPTDSLAHLERSVRSAIATNLVGSDRERVRSNWLLRAALLAVPNYQFARDPDLPQNTFLAQLLAAWRTRDLRMAHRVLVSRREVRRRGALRSSDLTADALYSEAAVLSSLGDHRAAIAWLDPTLDSLSRTAPLTLADGTRAASLVRAMALRADLAQRVGDTGAARKWAAAVVVLWSGADGFLQETVDRMKRMM